MDMGDLGRKALLLVSSIGSAGIGGVCFAFSSFVMRSLDTLAAPEVGRVAELAHPALFSTQDWRYHRRVRVVLQCDK